MIKNTDTLARISYVCYSRIVSVRSRLKATFQDHNRNMNQLKVPVNSLRIRPHRIYIASGSDITMQIQIIFKFQRILSDGSVSS